MSSLDKEKKVRLFLQADGKCEYCGCNMVLCFGNHCNIENLATFDHLYNRDHELRGQTYNREKRIYIVCRKCNEEKAKEEPNNHETNSVEKTIKKIVPKGIWTDERFMEKIRLAVEDEMELGKQMSKIDKEIRQLQQAKRTLERAVSKKAKYKNFLLQHLKELQSKER